MDSSKITANTSSLSSLMEDSKQQERVPSLLNMLRTTLSISGLPRCLKRLLEGIKHVPEPCWCGCPDVPPQLCMPKS